MPVNDDLLLGTLYSCRSRKNRGDQCSPQKMISWGRLKKNAGLREMLRVPQVFWEKEEPWGAAGNSGAHLASRATAAFFGRNDLWN